jgi:hypothetical protein
MIYLGLVHPDPSCSRLPFSSEILMASFLAYKKNKEDYWYRAAFGSVLIFSIFTIDLVYLPPLRFRYVDKCEDKPRTIATLALSFRADSDPVFVLNAGSK